MQERIDPERCFKINAAMIMRDASEHPLEEHATAQDQYALENGVFRL